MATGSGDNLYGLARDDMIADQLMRRGIHSASVLHAMAAIPRHLFVDTEYRRQAYEDCALPASDGQTISQPYMVAIMTQLLDVQPQHRVLEIGTGTGYQTAILAWLARDGHVYTIERIEHLAAGARRRLAELGVGNVSYFTGDGTMGWPGGEGSGVRGQGSEHSSLSSGPCPLTPIFNRILITAGTPEVPPPILAQLAEGGLLVAPRGDEHSQRLVVMTRKGAALSERVDLSCRFVPLIGQHGWKHAD